MQEINMVRSFMMKHHPNHAYAEQVTMDGKLIEVNVLGNELGDNGRYPVIATYTREEIENG